MSTRSGALSDALERLQEQAYLVRPGMPCHAPMAAESLSALGRDELVGAWVETYKERHPPLEAPPVTERLDPDDEKNWQPALGDPSRVSDWDAMFEGEFRDRSWPAVLRRWVPRLLPGSAGGLTHGLIRVAHGVRVLPAGGPASDHQVRELAQGLAYWASTFTTLPGRPDLGGPRPLGAAIAELPRVSQDAGWSPMEAGTFVRMGELRGFPLGRGEVEQEVEIVERPLFAHA